MLEDLDRKATLELWSSCPGSKSTFEVEVTLAIPVSGVFMLVVLGSMKVVQVAGARPDEFRGTAVIFQIGFGCGLKGQCGPFEVIGYGAVTGIFIAGDVTGIGWSMHGVITRPASGRSVVHLGNVQHDDPWVSFGAPATRRKSVFAS